MLKRFFISLKTIQPWMMILLLAGGYSIFTLIQHDWDPMAFVVIGKQFDPNQGITEMGYDGQFAYQIAKDPANAAPYLDEPAYRYQRILYPILAHLLALGNIEVIPWMLILINIVSLVLGTLATEKILQNHGHSRWYALAYGAFAGLLLSLRLNLTEPLAFALVQWGILFFDRGYLWRSLPFFALAALTRELTLFFAAACVITLWADRRFRRGLVWGLGVGFPFGLWQIFLRLWLGEWGVNSGGARASSFELIPFRGWWGYPYNDSSIFLLLSIFILLVALIPAMAGLIVSLNALWKGHHNLGVWTLLFNAIIFPFLPTSNVLNLPGLLRITIGLVVAVLNYGAIHSSRRALLYSQLWLVLLIFGEGLIAIY
jgi:hypothetical protein